MDSLANTGSLPQTMDRMPSIEVIKTFCTLTSDINFFNRYKTKITDALLDVFARTRSIEWMTDVTLLSGSAISTLC